MGMEARRTVADTLQRCPGAVCRLFAHDDVRGVSGDVGAPLQT